MAHWEHGFMLSFLDGRLLVRWDHVAVAEPLVRSLVSELIGRDPGPLHHTCPFCGSVEHGRPYVEAPVHVSVAHAPGLTLVAATDRGRVGVDLQKGADLSWVRREAVGKALGVGIIESGATSSEVETLVDEQLDVPGHAAALVVLSDPAAEAERYVPTTPRTAH